MYYNIAYQICSVKCVGGGVDESKYFGPVAHAVAALPVIPRSG
jgi:hypothetical protein